MSARYFPMAQEFNSDPEGWELTDKFGDRSLRIWVEILAIMDREKNQWRLVGGWDSVIARKVRQEPATVRRVVDWMLANGWLEVGQLSASGQPEVLRARNYQKFRRIRGEDRHAPTPTPTPTPTPKDHHKNDEEPATPAPSADSLKTEVKTGLDPAIKDVADRIYFSNRKKFAKLVVWIKEAQRERFSDKVIADALLRFERYAATADPWYPYLDKIIYKVEGEKNARESEAQSEQYKQELADYAQDLKH